MTYVVVYRIKLRNGKTKNTFMEFRHLNKKQLIKQIEIDIKKHADIFDYAIYKIT